MQIMCLGETLQQLQTAFTSSQRSSEGWCSGQVIQCVLERGREEDKRRIVQARNVE